MRASGAKAPSLIGTNDADNKGQGTYEATFQNCHLAALTWLATRPSDKLFPGDPSATNAGACTDTTNANGSRFFSCPVAGSISIRAFQTTGAPIYVWYLLADGASPAAAFSITVDGVTRATATTLPAAPIATQNGSSSSIGVARITPVSAGTHTLSVQTSTGGIAILAIGTNRALRPIAVTAGDVPNQRSTDALATVQTQLRYTALVRENAALAIADNLDIRISDDRTYMRATDAEMNDALHPNKLGHQNLGYAFSLVMP